MFFKGKAKNFKTVSNGRRNISSKLLEAQPPDADEIYIRTCTFKTKMKFNTFPQISLLVYS